MSRTAAVVYAPLKTCLVNLPSSLVSLLERANSPVQNVIVELNLGKGKVYMGWSGHASRALRDLPQAQRDNREAVEIEPTFARAIGLVENSQVRVNVHLDPPLTHTVNIEPATPEDWQIIELHATFLELNFLSQVRAIPNPAAIQPGQNPQPLSLHLSPTSTARVFVSSIVPSLPESQPFAKIAADAEVVVAPKTRSQQLPSHVRSDTRSSMSGKRSMRSATSRTSTKKSTPPSIFVRAADQTVSQAFLLDAQQPSSLTIFVSQSAIAAMKGASFVQVSVLQPHGLRITPEQDIVQRLKEEDASAHGRPSQRIVARLALWPLPTHDQHAILSNDLARILDVTENVGPLLRISLAAEPASRGSIKRFSFFPFSASKGSKKEGLKFGGESSNTKQVLVDRIRLTYGKTLLSGPLTDGMILPDSPNLEGGILRFSTSVKSSDDHAIWALGAEQKQEFDIKDSIPRPVLQSSLFPSFANTLLEARKLPLIGVDKPLKSCLSNLTLSASVLLCGSIGSGKTAIATAVGHQLRQEYLTNIQYLLCQRLITDETRISSIKEELSRIFVSASWCARLSGQSVIILDDIDKICPVETELQVGNDNGRSRQISEILLSLVQYHCQHGSGISILATSQNKDSVHNLLISTHVFSEIVSIYAPDKQTRHNLLRQLVADEASTSPRTSGHARDVSNGSNLDSNSWMTPSRPTSSHSNANDQTSSSDKFTISSSLDLLDVSGKTDGYMPADLSLLVNRARNESLIRNIGSSNTEQLPQLQLDNIDFTAALKNFTPTSLRNVTLTHSTTTFASVGGLRETRATLLETLSYPTKYAPIFAKAPLRLRSGLLLYGYPGTGKTLLAAAIAGETNLNFISVKGPEILNKYIGASEQSIRDLFQRATSAKPCILFFDEFDSIAPKRGHDSTGVTDRVVNQLLTQMDGAEGLEGVYVLAATSRPDLIDPALLRPGRLDKSLLCDMPGTDDREDILKTVSTKLHLGLDVESRLLDIATRTEGFTGADLQALMYNAHLEAIHDLLNDKSSDPAGSNGTKQPPTDKRSNSRPSNTKKKGQDFVQFLYGEEEDNLAKSSKIARDTKAEIVAKLEEIKNSRKLEKDLARGIRPGSFGVTDSTNTETADPKKAEVKVVIGWGHVERAMASTRSSISPQERVRLRRIYDEFVSGRDGSMPNGEGSRDVGGRTSLM